MMIVDEGEWSPGGVKVEDARRRQSDRDPESAARVASSEELATRPLSRIKKNQLSESAILASDPVNVFVDKT